MKFLNLSTITVHETQEKMKYETFRQLSVRSDQFGNDVSHFFSSRFSNGVAYLLFLSKFSPNMVTFLFLITGIQATVSLLAGNAIAAYLCWRLHIILDMADGNIARATKVFSPFADGFDKCNHIVINTLLIYTIAYTSQTQFTSLWVYLAFQLYYNFDRNFCVKIVGKKIEMDIRKVVLKNALTFEGYILMSLTLNFLELSTAQNTVNIFYTVSMFSLFLYKFKLGFK